MHGRNPDFRYTSSGWNNIKILCYCMKSMVCCCFFICLFVLFFKLCYAIQNYKNQRGKNKSLFRDLENLKWKLKKGLKSGKFPSNSSSGLNLTSYIFRHVTVDSIMAHCFTVPSLVCEKGRKNTPELQYWVLIFGVALSQLLGWGLNTFKHMFWDLRPGAKADMK